MESSEGSIKPPSTTPSTLPSPKSLRRENSKPSSLLLDPQHSSSQNTNGSSTKEDGTVGDAIEALVSSRGCGLPLSPGVNVSSSSPPPLTAKKFRKLFGKGMTDSVVLKTHSACMEALNSLIVMAAEKEQEIIELKERLVKNEEDLDLERRKALLFEMERRDLEDLVDWQRQELEEMQHSSTNNTNVGTDSEAADADSQSLGGMDYAARSDSPVQFREVSSAPQGWKSPSRTTGETSEKEGEKENRLEKPGPSRQVSFGSELKELKRELAQQKVAHERAVSAWNESEAQKSLLKSRLSTAEDQVRELLAENFQLRVELEERAEFEESNTVERLTSAEKQLSVLVRENQQLKSQLEVKLKDDLQNFALAEQAKVSEERFRDLWVENKKLRNEIDSYKDMEVEGMALLDKLKKADQSVRELVAENRQLREERFEQAGEERTLEINNLLIEKKNMANELEEEKKKKQEMEQAVFHFKKDVETLLQEKERKETELSNLRMQVMELMKELAKQSDILNKKSAELDRLQEKEKRVREETERARNQFLSVVREVDDFL